MTHLDWIVLAVVAVATLGFVGWVWWNEPASTPYPSLNGTKLEQAIREMLAESKSKEEGVWGACEFVPRQFPEIGCPAPGETIAESKEEE